MMPVGRLMIEHRLIERMINLLYKHIESHAGEDINLDLIEEGAGFLRAYADLCHHGKEEDILFLNLRAKPISAELDQILKELVEEHIVARASVKALAEACGQARAGDHTGYQQIIAMVGKIASLYPAHIEKEDKHFFIPIMNYFTRAEQEAMLKQFSEFDQQLIHVQYRGIVERWEDQPDQPTALESKGTADMAKYECTVCGYIYDPALGDPENGIFPGTPFDDLPDDWVCPLCGSGKDLFVKVA